jgi:hypothetical protein
VGNVTTSEVLRASCQHAQLCNGEPGVARHMNVLRDPPMLTCRCPSCLAVTMVGCFQAKPALHLESTVASLLSVHTSVQQAPVNDRWWPCRSTMQGSRTRGLPTQARPACLAAHKRCGLSCHVYLHERPCTALVASSSAHRFCAHSSSIGAPSRHPPRPRLHLYTNVPV